MPWTAVASLITRFIQDPEQREKALQAARDQYNKFLESTSGPLYQVYRFVLMLGAAWDFLLNSSGRAIEAAKTAGVHPVTFVWVEVLLMLWPFVGDKIVDPAMKLLTAGIESAFARRTALPTDAASQERWRRINEDMDRLNSGEK